MSERSWTVDEANRALRRVRDAVERARQAAVDATRAVQARAARASSNGHGHDDGSTHALRDALEELEADGIVVRDLERGLVDFPARAPSGRRYWLCWVVGEPAVEWWHWPEDGFAGRTPITELPE